MGTFHRVLIANRGEIAIRIARAADALGIESVAVHPPADERSLHTRVTTERRELRADLDPIAAYLDVDTLVRIATETGCDAVHPGYGFLAERAAFAQRCADAGITFIGPRPETLALFGDKVAARRLAASVGVPTVPGSTEAVAGAAEAARIAAQLGYPVMLKAAAGGGGRGMRQVDDAGALEEAFERCRSEAAAAFGDGTVFVERLLRRPRHIEVQVLADATGEVVHLYDRDCSVQQRHQKVIEVAPAVGLDPALRQRILHDAVTLARAAGYLNAGTVEFLVSPEHGEHAFIECNPRIQVEHTVTEQVTGIDLVEAQFRIAAGATLAELGIESQASVATRGIAVQARVVATGVGTLTGYQEPSGPGVRVDACGYPGYTPPPQFDPLLAKVVTTSLHDDIAAAVDRCRRAVEAFHVAGLPTNRARLLALLADPHVRAGDARTSLIAERDGADAVDPAIPNEPVPPVAPLAALVGEVAGVSTPSASSAPRRDTLPVAAGHEAVRSPMAGTVVEVRVGVDDDVRAGDALLLVSAMKTEAIVTAPCDGRISALLDLAPAT